MTASMATRPAVFIGLLLISASALASQRVPMIDPDVVLFTRQGCPRCAAAHEFLEDLVRQRPGLRVLKLDVDTDRAARLKLERLAREHAISTPGVPAFYLRGRLLIGFLEAETTGARIRGLLEGIPDGAPAQEPGACPQGGQACPDEGRVARDAGAAETVEAPLVGRLSVRELGLPLFTFVLGLLDGFNPCSMWVLLFLLSMLVNLRDRRMMLLLGGTFVLASGAVYFAFMAAWLNFFLLLGVSRVVQVALGLLALGMGALSMKDFFAFRKGPTLGIPESAKPGIYRRVRALLRQRSLPEALLGIIVLALLVNAVELLCTAGLPAVYTRILTLQDLPVWGYYGYLALYNLAYVLDDSVIVAVAVITLSRRKLQEREGRWLKLVSGVVMGVLGLLLLLRPAWLL